MRPMTIISPLGSQKGRAPDSLYLLIWAWSLNCEGSRQNQIRRLDSQQVCRAVEDSLAGLR